MGKFMSSYIGQLIVLLERIRDEEGDGLDRAASILADTVQQGGAIFAFGCTHSSLPVQDLVFRSGGLMLINPLFGPGIASLELRPATMTTALEQLSGFARIILDGSPIKSGDVLILVSVSGRNTVPVELAQLCSERGIKIIGVTSKEYAVGVSSRHNSGKKMHDYADVVLDNKAPKGDAILDDERVPQKFNPVSGVTSTAILQALVASTIEELLARGITPPIFLSANVDGGAEYNARLLEVNRQRIFFL